MSAAGDLLSGPHTRGRGGHAVSAAGELLAEPQTRCGQAVSVAPHIAPDRNLAAGGA